MRHFSLSLLLVLFFSVQSFASHIAGGTIKVQRVGGNDYEVTLILYIDCSGIPAPSSAILNFTDTLNSINNFNATLYPSGGAQSALLTCNAAQTTCNGGSILGIDAYMLTTTVTLPPGHWRISYSTCCRNANSTISNPTSNSFYLYTLVNNTVTQPNQLPIFKRHPKFVASTSFPGTINYTVSDFDGDSIAYKLTDALGGWNSPLTYLAGAGSGQTPFNLANPVSFPPNSGYLSYSVPTQMIAVVDVIVEEWRNINGTMTMLSQILLDHEVFFMQSPNHEPLLSGMDTTLTAGFTGIDTSYAAVVIANDTFSFAIWGNDQDPSTGPSPNGGTFIISQSNAITGSTFTTYHDNTDSSYAVFSWTPSILDTGKVYCFNALIADSACPYIGSSLYNYCFLVLDSGAVSLVSSLNGYPTHHFCDYESIEIEAPEDWDSYLWSTGHQTRTILLDSSNLVLGSNIITCEMWRGEFTYTAEIEVFMDRCSGIGEDLNTVYSVYPNPANSTITISGLSPSNTYRVELMNIHSQVLRSVSVSNMTSQTLYIEFLTPGTYILRIQNGEHVGYSRIVKD